MRVVGNKKCQHRIVLYVTHLTHGTVAFCTFPPLKPKYVLLVCSYDKLRSTSFCLFLGNAYFELYCGSEHEGITPVALVRPIRSCCIV